MDYMIKVRLQTDTGSLVGIFKMPHFKERDGSFPHVVHWGQRTFLLWNKGIPSKGANYDAMYQEVFAPYIVTPALEDT